MRGGKTRQVPPIEKQLIEPHIVIVNGNNFTLGACCKCGRSLHRSHLNKTGVRCYYEGAQYDRAGKFLFDAQTEKLYRAAVKAENSNLDECEDAYLALVEAAKEVCAQ